MAEAVIAVILAVAAAASLVEWRHLDHGQWVVWSGASVVTGDAGAAHLKLRDRAVGAFLGVPAGITRGFFVPHGPLAYGLAIVVSLLTLVAFRSYLIGFGTRCAAVAAALVIAEQSTVIAAERVINVLLGASWAWRSCSPPTPSRASFDRVEPSCGIPRPQPQSKGIFANFSANVSAWRTDPSVPPRHLRSSALKG